jgi:hypothetical protein
MKVENNLARSNLAFQFSASQAVPSLIRQRRHEVAVSESAAESNEPSQSRCVSRYLELADLTWAHVFQGTATTRSQAPSHLDWFARSFLSEQATRFAELYEQLDRMADLPEDWDTYGASPPNESSLSDARSILALFEKGCLTPTKVVPSGEGGVGIVFVRGEKYADVECLNDGDVLAAKYKGEAEPEVWEVKAPSEVVDCVRRHLQD